MAMHCFQLPRSFHALMLLQALAWMGTSEEDVCALPLSALPDSLPRSRRRKRSIALQMSVSETDTCTHATGPVIAPIYHVMANVNRQGGHHGEPNRKQKCSA